PMKKSFPSGNEMRRRDFLRGIVAGGVGLAGWTALASRSLWAASDAARMEGTRRRDPLDFDWRFHLGDVPGAEVAAFDDAGWRQLDLPHDWSVEGEIREDNPASWHGAYLPGGIGWYRKALPWDAAWEGKQVRLDFDGVYMNSDVWVNGHHLGRRPYGFISFGYDVTPYLQRGRNVIAVRADNSKLPSARWYTGSGIYRHVWLNVTHPVHVAPWGTFVTTPQVSPQRAAVRIATQVANDSDREAAIDVEQVIRRRDGGVVARSRKPATVAARSKSDLTHELEIANPQLWSPDE